MQSNAECMRLYTPERQPFLILARAQTDRCG